jgi:hypothetical protein
MKRRSLLVRRTRWPWLAALVWPGCQGPRIPETPTWADVEPIVRGQCSHCHGSTARTTGASGALAYRFDFFEVSPDTCGEAAAGVSQPGAMAKGWSKLILQSITGKDGGRARMPPAPAEPLSEYQREVIRRWAEGPGSQNAGRPPAGNRRPQVRWQSPGRVDARATIHVDVDDPDGESVVGVLKVGAVTFQMDRSGSFVATLNTASWAAGKHPVRAVVCDGWDSVSYELGTLEVDHGGLRTDAGIDANDGGLTADTNTGANDGGAKVDGAGADAGGPAPIADAGMPPKPNIDGGTAGPPDAADAALEVLPPPEGVCPDLDENGTLDCEETVIENAGFSRNATPDPGASDAGATDGGGAGGDDWAPEESTTLSFAEDRKGRPDSAALAVQNAVVASAPGSSLAGARHCLPVNGAAGTTAAAVSFGGLLFIPPGQTGSGQAGMNLQFFSTDNCRGPLMAAVSTPLVGKVGSWSPVLARTAAPPGSRSMALRLVVLKPFAGAPLQAYFDDLLVKRP